MKVLQAMLLTLAMTSTVAYAQQAPSSDNAKNTLASERAERNSRTGDRNPNNSGGNFGQDQSTFVQSLDSPYGQYLKDEGWTGTATAPGQVNQ